MKKFKFTSVTIISLFFVFQLIGEANAQSKTVTLAKSRYSDLNGYFRIVPPFGWQILKYPEDTRGKVAFIGPNNVELRILAKGLDYNSFDKMFEEIKGAERQLGVNTNIQKMTFLGRQAVKRTFTFKGSKILFIDFMTGNVAHNIMYTAPPTQYDGYLAIAQESIETYEPTLNSVSKEEIKKHIISKSLRLSKIFFDQKNYDLSLEYINEGLNVEANNEELLALKNKILAQSGKLNGNDSSKSTTKNEADSSDIKNKKDKQDTEPNPVMFMILTIVGALVLRFQKQIAAGTAAPGFARLTAPIIGFGLTVGALFGGLFSNGYIFLGILTSLIALSILASPILYPIIMERIRKK